ncbi:hypothetical protein JHK85_035786 [Glycine max]|nr:hypothetical protein JHK85_035786 [Glycine max]
MKEGEGEAMTLGERGRGESTILESIRVVIGILVIGPEAEPLLNHTEDGQEGGKARVERKNHLSGCTSITGKSQLGIAAIQWVILNIVLTIGKRQKAPTNRAVNSFWQRLTLNLAGQ